VQSRPIRPWQGRPAAAAGFEPAAALGGKGANAALLQNSQQAFPFALRALQDFRRGNHQHLKPPLLHITEQYKKMARKILFSEILFFLLILLIFNTQITFAFFFSFTIHLSVLALQITVELVSKNFFANL